MRADFNTIPYEKADQYNKTAKQTKKPGTLQLSLPASAAFQPSAQQHTDTFWEDREGVPVPSHSFPAIPKPAPPGAGSKLTPLHIPGISHVLSHHRVHPLGSWHSWTPALVATFDPSVHLHQAPDDGLSVVPLPDVHFCGEVAAAGLRVHQKHGHARL